VARIFEPFFTTKAGGTGLGLAIARNIAKIHGGDLVLSANEPGRVCFTLTFPVANKDSQPA
jgi:signal transduction histidine kinase